MRDLTFRTRSKQNWAKTPAPLHRKVSHALNGDKSKPCFNDFYKRRELNSRNESIQRFWNTPLIQLDKNILEANDNCINEGLSVEDIMNKLKMRLLLKAYVLIKRKLTMTTKLAILTKGLKHRLTWSWDYKFK